MPKKKYVGLTIEQKVKVLAYLDESHSEREAAREFGISKGAVSKIKKMRQSLESLLKNPNFSKSRCRKIRKTENEEINEMTWTWYEKVQTLNIPLSGSMIKKAALKYAGKLNKENFKASDGWLCSFMKRHCIEIYKTKK